MSGITLAQEEPATAPPPDREPPEPAPLPLGPRRARLVLLGLLLTLLLAALEPLAVATALPRIAGELDGMDRMSWAIAAPLLATAVGLPVHGRLGDRYGYRTVFRFALAVFIAGSALAGWSRTMDQLVVFRALQGLGAGGLLTGVQMIAADIAPAGRRGRFLGAIGAVFGLASLAGPLLGGLLTDHLSWRWCFLLNIPFGLITLAAVALVPKPPKNRPKARPDVLGALLLTAASASLVLLAGWGGTAYAWNSPVVLGLAASALAATALFLLTEHRAADPLIPLRLFRDPVVTVTWAVGCTTGVALFAACGYLPLHLQMAGGMSATASGLFMLPMTAGIVGASVLAGELVSRTGHYRTYPVLGTAVAAVGMWLLARLEADTPPLYFAIGTAVLGAGIGTVMPVLVLAVQNAVRPADAGIATGAGDWARHLGGSVGVALFGALLAGRLADRLPPRAGDGWPDPAALGPEAVHALPAVLRDEYTGAYAEAVPGVFGQLVPVLVLGLLLAFVLLTFLKGRPLVSDSVPESPPVPPTRSPHTGEPTVRGTVRRHDGMAVARAALTLLDVTGQQTGRGTGGEDGRYALTAPGPGAYVLIAAADGHQPQAVTVTVGKGPVDVDMVLGGTGRLIGRVATADGNPLPDAAVTVTDVQGQIVATTRSGPEGGYAVTDLPAGEYTLTAAAHTFRPAALPVTVRPAREIHQNIELAGGEVLRGTVRAGAGRPVDAARVTLLDTAGNVVGTLVTGPDGTYCFADLAAGEYTLVACGYPPAATVLEVAGGSGAERDMHLGHDDEEG
ncbi:MFS transporter [Streptomyces poonensis]|uniref:alpha-amylase n=1 Tax=Streptomyces poonensis TaxID=68255 RepID=A0A918UGM9_9ACTN|nr:MFS transporter [Streptomyces poonensis]GGZ05243.1 MFS transporter [Streptomyces poonensis]